MLLREDFCLRTNFAKGNPSAKFLLRENFCLRTNFALEIGVLQFFEVPPGGSVVSPFFPLCFLFCLLFVFAALVGSHFFRIFRMFVAFLSFFFVFLWFVCFCICFACFFVICFLAFFWHGFSDLHFFAFFVAFFRIFFQLKTVAMEWLLFDEVVTHLCLPATRSFGNQHSISWSLRSFLEVSVQKNCLPSYVLAIS